MTATHGLIDAITAHADSTPDRVALAFTTPGDAPDDSVTFGELRARAERYASGLRAAGFRTGDRIMLALPLSADFYALALAIVGSGMAVVLVDGALDRRRILSALRSARARAIVASAAVLRRWWLVPPLCRMRRYADDGATPGVRALDTLLGSNTTSLRRAEPDAPAIVSFTSGSAGRAKGVVRTHAILLGQHHALARHLPHDAGDVDMTCFPAVVLHNLCLGITTILPPIDLRRPADADAAAVIDVARRTGVTTFGGAPAYMDRVVGQMRSSGQRLPAVRRVAVGGAPVSRGLCRRVIEMFPEAQALIVYGATEVEPIAHVEMQEVLAADGDGLLVGEPVPEVDVVVANLPERIDAPLDRGALAGARAPVGEVVVRGRGVSRAYIGDPAATAAYKVHEPGGAVWHRTGDIARRDERGRLWLLGRRDDAVCWRGTTVHPLPLEAAVRELPGVRNAALVAHSGAPDGELLVVADSAAAVQQVPPLLDARGLAGLAVRRVDDIPMDRRHGSKVDRAALAARMAANRRS